MPRGGFDSSSLFPEMLKQTRLLIIDYDVTRFHSLDVFNHLLSDKEMYRKCNPNILAEYRTFKTKADQVLYYKRNSLSMNPYDNFPEYLDTMKLAEYEAKLNEMFDLEDGLNVTPTDVDSTFGQVFLNKSVFGYLLKYTKDPHEVIYSDLLKKTYTTNNVLDLRMAIAVIKQHNINAVMIASLELALVLATRLASVGYTAPITFMTGTYRYNYDARTGIMKHIKLINSLDYKYHHEFGIFDPFSGITHKRENNNGKL